MSLLGMMVASLLADVRACTIDIDREQYDMLPSWKLNEDDDDDDDE
jgi:hypothetical protein